ncbi:MAG TPA: MBL fold metallo-hydrolase [Solirubrobacteraceae bacterium]|nr:MBL fold metallo-hydrolase [Solirubrobacteraceae bacterium]
MRKPTRSREVGRGEKVIPGIWRLRLPLPWPGVPHCNAWALASGPGIVLVDTGMHEPGSMAHLERALDQAGLKIEHVRLIVCTHAHVDHCGQAPAIAERAGCEVWMHHDHAHHTDDDPEEALKRRVVVAHQSGVPPDAVQRAIERRRGQGSGQAGTLQIDRELNEGDTIATDLGAWQVVETPGHAPSHICLYQPERRVLISGDHLLGRVSLYFDVGYTPDPVGEFLDSLDKVERLDARLVLAGHARPFTDVAAHVAANRDLAEQRLDAVREALPGTAFEIAQRVYGERFSELTGSWLLSKTRAWLTHLEAEGLAERAGDTPECWSVAA